MQDFSDINITHDNSRNVHNYQLCALKLMQNNT